jgi:hypothetical protein
LAGKGRKFALGRIKGGVIIDRLKLISYDHRSSKQKLYYAFSTYLQKEKKGEGAVQWDFISDGKASF